MYALVAVVVGGLLLFVVEAMLALMFAVILFGLALVAYADVLSLLEAAARVLERALLAEGAQTQSSPT